MCYAIVVSVFVSLGFTLTLLIHIPIRYAMSYVCIVCVCVVGIYVLCNGYDYYMCVIISSVVIGNHSYEHI